MATLFTRIVRGEIPCHNVLEDDAHLAFMDINPNQPGHVLVVPKDEIAYLFDMTPEAYGALWQFTRRVEAGVREATMCQRVVVVVVGYEVPHVHIHLIPTNDVEDYPIPPKIEQTPTQLAETAAKIGNAIE